MVAKRTRLFLSSIIAVLLLSLSFNLVAPYTSYADYAPGTDGKCEDGKVPEGAEKDGEKQCAETQRASTPENDNPAAVDDNATECAIAKMGWILCPVIETAAKAADNIHGLLSRMFLNIEPELLSSNTDRGTYVAWSYARNIANIAGRL